MDVSVDLNCALLCSCTMESMFLDEGLPLCLYNTRVVLTYSNMVWADEIEAVSSSDHPAAAD